MGAGQPRADQGDGICCGQHGGRQGVPLQVSPQGGRPQRFESFALIGFLKGLSIFVLVFIYSLSFSVCLLFGNSFWFLIFLFFLFFRVS